MIKGFGFGKLLKQLFIISLISCFGFGVSSFVSAYDQDFDLLYSEEINDGTHNYFELKNNGNFLLNDNYKYFSYSNGNFMYNFMWFDSGIYLTVIRPGTSQNNIITYGEGVWQGYIPFCQVDISTSSVDCPYLLGSSPDTRVVSDFYVNSVYSNPSKFSVGANGNNIWGCFYYDNITDYKYCFGLDYSFNFYKQKTYFTGSLGLTTSPSSPSYYNSVDTYTYITNSTWSSSGGGTGTGGDGTGSDFELGEGGIELQSDESAINYFETYYGRDEKICYAGVDNLTDLFGTNGVSFQEGTGLNIFQVYSGTYGTPELNRVYVWLNSQLINYGQWFNNDGDPLFLSNYNSGTNQVDIYYDSLIFPFSGKPVAYYFLASNIFNYSNPTEGSKIVSYCNLKINGGSFDDIIDQSVKNNINNYTEQSNKNNGLNPDGTQKIIIYNNFDSYTGDVWISSGVDIAFSGNTSLQNTLKNFFDRFDNAFNNIELVTTNKILPSYLVTAFLFVVLFKFLRKRK